MACWSAWTNDGSFSAADQYDATPHVLPPSSERKRSTPAAHTRFASFGSTAMTLQCHPMLLRFVVLVDAQPSPMALCGLVSSIAPKDEGLLSVCTCAVQVPAAPPCDERKTAKRPWSNVPPLRAASA